MIKYFIIVKILSQFYILFFIEPNLKYDPSVNANLYYTAANKLNRRVSNNVIECFKSITKKPG